MFYSSERYFKDERNHYDRYERDALCSSCGAIIGIQTKYCGIYNEFFFNNREKEEYIYCPYCSHEFDKNR